MPPVGQGRERRRGHLPSEYIDHARVLSDRDELSRLDRVPLLGRPGERLESGDPTGRQLDDRLIVDPQQIAFDGTAQRDLGGETVGDATMHRGVEHGAASSPAPLGVI